MPFHVGAGIKDVPFPSAEIARPGQAHWIPLQLLGPGNICRLEEKGGNKNMYVYRNIVKVHPNGRRIDNGAILAEI